MSEPAGPKERLWSFPKGMLGRDDSIKGFEVEASDGRAGKGLMGELRPR